MSWRSITSLDAGGARLEAKTIGPSPSEAPTLVFLHEGLGSVSMWRDFPEALGERTRLGGLVYSRAGYGASSPAVLPRRADYMHVEGLEVLPAVLAAAGVDRPILVGHSDGGSIAILHAGAGNAPAPLALLLEAPHVFVEQLSVDSIAKAKVAFREGELRDKLAKHHRVPVDDVFRGWNDVWLSDEFRRFDIQGYAARIGCPTLAIQGVDDAYGTRRQVDAIAERARADVEVLMLPECGHSPHRDQRDRVIDSMASFLDRFVSS